MCTCMCDFHDTVRKLVNNFFFLHLSRRQCCEFNYVNNIARKIKICAMPFFQYKNS